MYRQSMAYFYDKLVSREIMLEIINTANSDIMPDNYRLIFKHLMSGDADDFETAKQRLAGWLYNTQSS